jgi:hypothetical protein
MAATLAVPSGRATGSCCARRPARHATARSAVVAELSAHMDAAHVPPAVTGP